MYPNSLQALEAVLARAPDTHTTLIARRIIAGAKAMDLSTSQNLGVHQQYVRNGVPIKRDYKNPVYFDHDNIIGAPGADLLDRPLSELEQWHKGRRASHTGVIYDFNAAGLPINPFLNTGMLGRGLLWQYGPNHAVDNGILVTRTNESGVQTLYAVGIHRKDRANVPSLSGGFAKFNQTGTGYVLDRDAIINSCVEELFEEMISGSVDLLPAYAERVESKYKDEIARRMQNRTQPYEAHILEEIHEQIVTALKMEQVFDLDYGFMMRLRDLVIEGRECYAGPVLNSNRATNNAWIETILSWVHLTDEKWASIKGDNPVFDYKFSAGDDADSVHYFEVGRGLIQNANKSHAPLFAFMTASYLLDAQEKNMLIDPHVFTQICDVADYLEAFLPGTKPQPFGYKYS